MLCKLILRVLALCVLATAGWPAAAQVGDVATLGAPAPFWVQHPNGIYATLDYDIAGGRYYQAGIGAAPDPKNLLTTARTSVGYAPDSAGLFYSFANNIPRITNLGLLVEESRTNDALWSRDMTNAAWTKVGLGTALNATGIDGTANSATTLTATGTAGVCTSSCTALQAITLGSTADTYSVYLKRVAGSGTVNITINNLTGATACTLTTTAFTQCQVTATLANPVIGIQLTTLNDVVIADFNQMEPGGFATSPILTTTVAATRAVDAITAKLPPTFGTAYTLLGSGVPNSPASNAADQTPAEVDDGTANNLLRLRRNSAAGTARYFVATVGTTVTPGGSNTWTTSVLAKMAAAVSSGAAAVSFNGGTVGTAAPSGVAAASALRFGTNTALTGALDGTISRVALWPTVRLPNASLQSVSQ